jgi:hypothetical protein
MKLHHWWLWEALWEAILYPIVEYQQSRHNYYCIIYSIMYLWVFHMQPASAARARARALRLICNHRDRAAKPLPFPCPSSRQV